jgi:hypothetical protein
MVLIGIGIVVHFKKINASSANVRRLACSCTGG